MRPEEFSKVPKLYAENISIAFNQEAFAMLIASGDVRNAFALSPGHAKRLAQYVAHQVADYEKQFDNIQGPDWNPNQPSPIQPPDLNPKKK